MSYRSNQIELLAVNKISDFFVQSDKFEPFIPVKDKEPCWDGSLYLTPKKHEYQRIPVQVKGKVVKKLPKIATYPISVVYLNNYMRDGGIIFFVVYIIGTERYPYYAKLAPIDAKRYIKKAAGHETISVRLQPLTENLEQLENDVTDFYTDCKKQTSFVDSPILTIDEALNKRCKINFHFTGIHSQIDFFTKIGKRPVYLYAEMNEDGKTIEYPIGDQAYDILAGPRIKKDITVNGQSFYKDFCIFSTDQKIFNFVFGKSFNFIIDSIKKEAISKYEQKTTSLSEVLNELYFLQAVYKHKHVMFGDFKLKIHDSDEQELESINKQIDHWEKVKKVLTLLNVHDDIDTTKLTKSDSEHLEVLIESLLNKNQVSPVQPIGPVISIEVLNYTFVLLAEQVDKDQYILRDYFEKIKEGMTFAYHYPNDPKHQLTTSPFTFIFNQSDFTTFSNIKYEDMVYSYEYASKTNPEIYERANWDLLAALNAYDKLEQKDEILYQALKDLSDWLLKNDPKSNIIHRINKYQIIKRKRDLTKEEKKDLNEIVLTSKIGKDVETSIHLLLDNKTQAEFCYEDMTIEEQKNFMKYPISFFLKKL